MSWESLSCEHWFRTKAREIWLANRSIGDSPAIEGMLSNSMEHIFSARSAFKDDANQSIAALLASFAGAGALLVQAAGNSSVSNQVVLGMLAALAFFSLPLLVFCVYRRKITAGYDLYISACVHSAMLYCAFQIPFTFEWHKHVVAYLKVEGAFVPRHGIAFDLLFRTKTKNPANVKFVNSNGTCRYAKSTQEIIEVWKSVSGNLWLLHRRSLQWGIVLGVVAGLLSFAWCIRVSQSIDISDSSRRLRSGTAETGEVSCNGNRCGCSRSNGCERN